MELVHILFVKELNDMISHYLPSAPIGIPEVFITSIVEATESGSWLPAWAARRLWNTASLMARLLAFMCWRMAVAPEMSPWSQNSATQDWKVTRLAGMLNSSSMARNSDTLMG